MNFIRALIAVAAFAMCVMPAQARAQAPDQPSAIVEMPAGMERWSRILSIAVNQLVIAQGIHRAPEIADEAQAWRDRARSVRSELEASVDELRTETAADDRATAELRAAQMQMLDRLDDLALEVETVKIAVIANELDRTRGNRWVMLAQFRETNLIQAAMADSLHPLLEPRSFFSAWNRAFALTNRVEALELTVRMTVLRGEQNSEQAGAGEVMQALAGETRLLGDSFAHASELTAQQRATLADVARRHADVLMARLEVWSALDPATVLADANAEYPNLMNELSVVVQAPVSPL